MELTFFQTPTFQEMLLENKRLKEFKALLSKFLEERFLNIYPFTPSRIDFSIFQDPETGGKQPKVIIHLRDEASITIPELNASFTREFKSFLAEEIEVFEDFLEYRKIQRNFMIIFKME